MPRFFGVGLTAVLIAVSVAVTSRASHNTWLAVAGGVVISIVSWLLTILLTGPRLEVSKDISVVCDGGDTRTETRYRVKVLNRSRLFDVGDVTLQAQLVVTGLNPAHPTNATTFAIPVSAESPFPVLYRRSRKWRRKQPGWKRLRAARVYTLRHRDLRGGGIDRLTEPLTLKLLAGTLELAELLGVGSDAFVRVVVTAAHPLSGYRRWRTAIYESSNLVLGGFDKHDTTAVRPSGTR